MIMTQTMHIRFLSEEYKDRDFTGKQYCIDHGIEIYYHTRKHDFSSSDLRSRTYQAELIKKSAIKTIEDIREIPQYSPELIKHP